MSNCQYQKDYFVFTARLSCKYKDRKDFKYHIEWFERNLFTDQLITPHNNVGYATDGEVLVNNFGKLYGDGFLDWDYEVHAIIVHTCTQDEKSYLMIRHEFEDCDTFNMRSCRVNIAMDVTEQGAKLDNSKQYPWDL
uniref:Uncharacterized protein n=1 Tax=Caenorhabditis japonica TaxID=281687 RepID=A0A8R1ENC7_CAEJA